MSDMYGKDEKCIQNLVGKFEGKRPFQKPTCIRDSNITGWSIKISHILKSYKK